MLPANDLDGFLEKYFEELSSKNWTLIPIDADFSTKLLNSAKSKLDSKLFKVAGLSKTPEPQLDVRNDSIFWLDAESELLTQADILALVQLDSLKDCLKSYFRVHLSEFECHYAIYKPGQFYQRHRDATAQNNMRIFTFVIYLNESWSPDDGGQTIGYEGDRCLFKIEPVIGNMLLFKSELEHEVLTTLKNRYTLTGWFRK